MSKKRRFDVQPKASERTYREVEAIAKSWNAFSDFGMFGAMAGEFAAERFDVDETLMLAQQLEQMRARVYETQYTKMKAREILPVTSDVDAGAEYFSTEERDLGGDKADLITNFSTDLKSASASATKILRSAAWFGDSYEYSIMDIARASFSGKPLNAMKAMSARRMFENRLNETAALGWANAGIDYGFCNQPMGTGSTQVRNTAMTSASWTDASFDADVVVSDVNQAVREYVVDCDEHYEPDTLVLPTAHYHQVAQKRMSSDNAETVLEAILRANPTIKNVTSWNKLKEVDGTGGNNSRGALFKSDPFYVELINPQDFTVQAPQLKNLAYVVNCYGKTAGFVLNVRLSMRYLSALPDSL